MLDLSKMTTEEARAVVQQAQNVFDASIADQQRTSPKEIQSLPIDLSVARTRANAMKVSFPFKSLLVEQATDLNTFVYLIPISNDSGNDPIKLGLKDVYKSEYGFRECYIYWNAQPSKIILLKFFVRSIIENGRLVIDNQSGNNQITMAGINSQDNGFTVIAKASGINIAANTDLSFSEVFPNDGFSKTFDSFKRGIVVPVGYIAKILSWRVTLLGTITTSNAAGPSFNLMVNKNITTATGATGKSSLRGSSVLTGGTVSSGILFVSNNLPFDPTEATNVIDENTLIFLKKTSQSTAGDNTLEIEIMLRFEPKIGSN